MSIFASLATKTLNFTALVLASMAVLATAEPVQAQTGLEPPPPFQAVDQFGVDLTSGILQVTSPTISVGDPEQGGLSFNATWDSRASRWRYSTWGEVSEELAKPDPYCLAFVSVVYLGSSNIFQRVSCTSNDYDRQDGYGSLVRTATGYIYTARDGSVAVYSGHARHASIQSITRLNGEVITYGDGTISNNLGYQLRFETNGSETKVTALNNAVDSCPPVPTVCTYSQVWPSLTFNSVGLERHVTDALGRKTRLILSDAGSGIPNVLGVARPSKPTGASVTYGYGFVAARGTVVTSASDGAGSWTYAYESYCPPAPHECVRPEASYDLDTTVTDPNSQATVYNVIWDGRYIWNPALSQELMFLPSLRSIKNALNQTTGVSASGAGFNGALYPEGNSIVVTRNDQGNPTAITVTPKPGSTLSTTSSTVIYPDCAIEPILCHRPSSMTDARGNVTNYAYDAAGNLLSATAPAPTPGAVRPQTRYAWQQKYAWYKQGGSTAITQAATPVWVQVKTSACATLASCDATANEVLTATTYQAGSAGLASNLLPISISSGSGDGLLTATSTSTYDGASNVLTVDGPLAGTSDTTRYVWDAMRQQVGVIGPDPDGAGSRLYPATRTTYNADGQVIAVEQGTTTGQTNTNWAAFSALQTATTAYNAQARKVLDSAADGTASATVSQYSYDAAGRLTCSTQRMNPAIFGSLPTSACALGTESAFGRDRIAYTLYDAADRVLSVTSGYLSSTPMTESQTWTTNGKLSTRSDGNGNLSTYVYDGFDRISRLRFPNASGGGSSFADYEEYGYDAANNPTSKRVRSGGVFTTTFDALNRSTFVDAPAGTNDVTYAYDNLGRMTTASIPSQTIIRAWDGLGRMTSETGPLGAMSYQYDLAGRRLRQTWPDSFFVTNTWSLANEMTATLHAGTTQIIGYSYDNLGRRTGMTRGNGVTSSYGYDAASRLTSLSHNVGGTDADVTFGYTYNPASQLINKTVSNSAYLYSPSLGATAYANNGLNRVTTVGGAAVSYDANGNITHDATRAFTYDAANRLTGANGGSSTLSYDPLDRLYDYVGTYGGRYLYDGAETVGFATSGTTINTRFIRGPGVDEIVANYASTGPIPAQYWAADERGSLVNLSNGATGANTIINTYDEYGVPAATNLGRLQYTGQLWMPDFGAYHYKARAYQPGLGRFLQTDPVGYVAGLNVYAYVSNDPVNATDPTGLIGPLPGGGFGYTVVSAGQGPDGRDDVPGATGAVVGAAVGVAIGVAASGACDIASAGICLPANPSFVAGSAALGAATGVAVETALPYVSEMVTTTVSDVIVTAQRIHGNSYQSTRPTWSYEIVNLQDEVQKFGITSRANPTQRYPRWWYEIQGFRMTNLTIHPNRAQARAHERASCQAYVAENGQMPPRSWIC